MEKERKDSFRKIVRSPIIKSKIDINKPLENKRNKGNIFIFLNFIWSNRF